MAIKTWTALGVGRETSQTDLSSQRALAREIRRRTRTDAKRDRRTRVRAAKERRRASPKAAVKPKPAPALRRALPGTEM